MRYVFPNIGLQINREILEWINVTILLHAPSQVSVMFTRHYVEMPNVTESRGVEPVRLPAIRVVPVDLP